VKNIFIVLRQQDGLATSHYLPIKTFDTHEKAIKYLTQRIKVVPLNVTTDQDSIQRFLQAEEQVFGKIATWGQNEENETITNRYKIMRMELE